MVLSDRGHSMFAIAIAILALQLQTYVISLLLQSSLPLVTCTICSANSEGDRNFTGVERSPKDCWQASQPFLAIRVGVR